MTDEDIQMAMEAFEADMKECHCECDMPKYAETIRTCLKQAMVAQEMVEALEQLYKHTAIWNNPCHPADASLSIKVKQALAKWEEIK